VHHIFHQLDSHGNLKLLETAAAKLPEIVMELPRVARLPESNRGAHDLKHFPDSRFVANVEAVMPIVRKFPFKWPAAAPDDVTTSTSVMLHKGATDALSSARDQDNLILSHRLASVTRVPV
jgi:hypothetical protein